MRLIASVGLSLILAGVAGAQTTTTTTTSTSPTTIYDTSASVMDSFGNLVVIDSGATFSVSTSTSGRPFRGPSTPSTRITVIQPGGAAPMTQVYNASIQLVGAGQFAVYAVEQSSSTTGSTVTQSQNLIAINPQVTLPSATSGFPSWAITTRAQVQLDYANSKADYISIVDLPAVQLPNSSTPAARNAVVVQFTGGANGNFVKVSGGALP